MRLLRLFSLAILLLSISACQRNDLENLRDTLHVRRNNADMPAYIYGNGSSKVFLIVLHGGPGGSGLEYRIGTYAERLEERYAMVYWDQRGQGMSQGKLQQAEITIGEMVKDLKALALTLQHKYGSDIDLFLMGHSWGGLLGSAFLTTDDNQDLFKGWIEVSGAHDFPAVYHQSVLGFQEIGKTQLQLGNDVSFWENVLDRIAQVDTFSINFQDFSYMNGKARDVEERLTALGEIAEVQQEAVGSSVVNTLLINSRTIVATTGSITSEALFDQGLLEFSVTEDLGKIQIPSLILWGQQDLVVPVSLGFQALENIGSADKALVIYQRSGHSPMINEPEPFVDDIVEFIDRLR